MKAILAPDFPKTDKNTLLVAFLSEEFANQTSALFSIAPSENAATDSGKRQLLNQDGKTLLTIGMGAKPNAEAFRKAAHQATQLANDYGYELIVLAVADIEQDRSLATAITEGFLLSGYQFNIYKSEAKAADLNSVHILGSGDALEAAIETGRIMADATSIGRDLVNEPVITLTAEELSRRIRSYGEQYGFEVEVLHKAKIQALKMGGLLAVNLGSIDPPTFSIMEHKPANPRNEKPVILVGKGVVYDTGGLSLKPTANSMDFMKADMGGAAAVVGAICGLAEAKSDVWVIGLIPATDNRPGQNAYVPGDVIEMYDGSTVEVLNTDAEGRMILADALAYAKQYDPELVIDLATLTGASVVAVGSPGIPMMATADESQKSALKAAGETVYERLVEFPLWEEYKDMLKSDIADQKNIGGREAGAITAGKFLEAFTDYPWIHLDIAGPSWRFSPDSYRGKNGTGVGVRLLFQFIQQYGQA
ncbi:MAG: M17 family metallopeptidase [Bacteroidia bacterium]